MPEETVAVTTLCQRSVNKPSLKKSFMLTYGTGQAIDLLVNNGIGIFLLLYLTSVCGLRPDVAGLVLFISLAVDAVADPLIGAGSDGWKSRLGRRHPFMIAGLIVLPLAIVALFNLPAALPVTWIFGYVLVLNILLRVSTSFFILPYAALLPEFSSDYEERSRMMNYRLIFAVIGWGIALWLSFDMFFKSENALSQASSYVPFAFLMAGLIILCGLTTIFGTLTAAIKLGTPPEEHSPVSRFLKEILQLFRNPSFVSLFFGVLIFMVAAGFLNSINLHTFRYFWNLTPEQMQMPTVAQPVGMLISIPLAMWLIKVVEKRTIMFIAVGVFVITYSAMPLLKSHVLLSAAGLAPIDLAVASGIVFGACSGLSFMSSGSMVADATDEHDFLFGVRREGLYFASLVFAAKAAIGLGGMLAGFGLKLIGFPGNPTSPEGAAQLTPEVIHWLGLLWGPGFAVCMLLSVPFFLRYRLDRKKHRKIMSAITTRNATCETMRI